MPSARRAAPGGAAPRPRPASDQRRRRARRGSHCSSMPPADRQNALLQEGVAEALPVLQEAGVAVA
jgi:hypothetical protein